MLNTVDFNNLIKYLQKNDINGAKLKKKGILLFRDELKEQKCGIEHRAAYKIYYKLVDFDYSIIDIDDDSIEYELNHNVEEKEPKNQKMHRIIDNDKNINKSITLNKIMNGLQFPLTHNQLRLVTNKHDFKRLMTHFGTISVNQGILTLKVASGIAPITPIYKLEKILGILMTIDEIKQIRREIKGNDIKNKEENIDISKIDVLQMNDNDFFNSMINTCKKGIKFTEHKKRGSSSERCIIIDNGRLSSKSGSMHLSKITQVMIGKNTKALKHNSLNNIPNNCCFTVFAGNSQLNLSTKNIINVRKFIAYLSGLQRHFITQNSNSMTSPVPTNLGINISVLPRYYTLKSISAGTKVVKDNNDVTTVMSYLDEEEKFPFLKIVYEITVKLNDYTKTIKQTNLKIDPNILISKLKKENITNITAFRDIIETKWIKLFESISINELVGRTLLVLINEYYAKTKALNIKWRRADTFRYYIEHYCEYEINNILNKLKDNRFHVFVQKLNSLYWHKYHILIVLKWIVDDKKINDYDNINKSVFQQFYIQNKTFFKSKNIKLMYELLLVLGADNDNFVKYIQSVIINKQQLVPKILILKQQTQAKVTQIKNDKLKADNKAKKQYESLLNTAKEEYDKDIEKADRATNSRTPIHELKLRLDDYDNDNNNNQQQKPLSFRLSLTPRTDIDVYCELYEKKENIDHILWDPSNIAKWIISINPKLFQKYKKSLISKLKQNNINGYNLHTIIDKKIKVKTILRISALSHKTQIFKEIEKLKKIRINYESWTTEDIVTFLISINPQKFKKLENKIRKKLKEQEISGKNLHELENDDIEDLGFNQDDCDMIYKKITEFINHPFSKNNSIMLSKNRHSIFRFGNDSGVSYSTTIFGSRKLAKIITDTFNIYVNKQYVTFKKICSEADESLYKNNEQLTFVQHNPQMDIVKFNVNPNGINLHPPSTPRSTKHKTPRSKTVSAFEYPIPSPKALKSRSTSHSKNKSRNKHKTYCTQKEKNVDNCLVIFFGISKYQKPLQNIDNINNEYKYYKNTFHNNYKYEFVSNNYKIQQNQNDIKDFFTQKRLMLIDKKKNIKYNGLIVIIASHGNIGCVTCSNNEKLKIKEIRSLFKYTFNINLLNLPKLFLIHTKR